MGEEEPMNNINQNAMDIDFEQNNDQKWEMKINEMRQEYETKLKEYNGLSMKLVQNEMKFEEKMAEFNHLRQQKKAMDEEMNGLQKQYANESMLKIVYIESKHKEQMNVLSQSYEFKLTDFEHDIKEKEKKIEQYETNKLSLECKLNFMNTCTMDQLRRIAVESYKSAMNAGCLIQELQMEKVKLIDTIINNPSFGNGTNGLIMKGIEEEP